MTKVKIGGTVIALILVWILVVPVINTNLVKAEKKNIREVTIAVDFDPSQRPSEPAAGRQLFELVSIQIIAGPDRWPRTREANSPYIRTVYVNKGQTVIVEVEQHYGVRIGCAISQVGYPIKHANAHGPSRITCRHVAL